MSPEARQRRRQAIVEALASPPTEIVVSTLEGPGVAGSSRVFYAPAPITPSPPPIPIPPREDLEFLQSVVDELIANPLSPFMEPVKGEDSVMCSPRE